MSKTITLDLKQDEKGRFLPGNSGNGGRQIGARNKLGEQFIDDVYEDWKQHGIQAIVDCRKESPSAYCKLIAGLLPKDINLMGAQGEQWLEALENFNQIAKAHRARLIEQKSGGED